MIVDRRTERVAVVIRIGIFALLLLSPMAFGAVPTGAVLVIELWAAVLGTLSLVVVWRDRAAFPGWGGWLLGAAGIVIAVGLVQLLPLPLEWTRAVAPPTAEARHDVATVVAGVQSAWMPVSIEAPATLDAILRFVSYLLVGFSAAVTIRERSHMKQTALVLAVSVAFQGFYGAAEHLSGHQHIFGFAKVYMLDSATGTFVNRNHYAIYLAMALPFTLWLVLDGWGNGRVLSNWRSALIRLGGTAGIVSTIGIVAAALGWCGILLSSSRSGLAAGLLATGILLARMRYGVRTSLVALLVLLLPTFGLLWLEIRSPGERFMTESSGTLDLGGRLEVWQASLESVRETFVFGTGYGTFERVFPLYRAATTLRRWEHAHNDYVQVLLEGGILVAIAIAGGLVLAIRSVRRGRGRGSVSVPSSAALASLAALAVSAMVDFPLRIPCIPVLLAVVLAAYFNLEAGRDRSPDRPRELAVAR
jgi:O-antigen ligase